MNEDEPGYLDEGRRVVRVFHDYGARWPLWESGTDAYNMEPDDYGLSADLTELLRRCGELFDSFDHEHGWPSEGARNEYADGMRRAVAQLRTELWGTAGVKDEHGWCLQDSGH